MLTDLEFSPPGLAAGLVGFAAGLTVSIAAVLPLARIIPERMLRGWKDEFGDDHPMLRAFEDMPARGRTWLKPLLCIAGGGLVALVCWRLGFGVASAVWSFYLLGMLLLASINARHQLLPDSVVFSLLWGGLLYRTWQADPSDYVLGCALAYSLPYGLLTLIRLTTGKNAMGSGDLKAFAMAGAWFGFDATVVGLPVFIAVLIAAAIVAAARNTGRSTLPTGIAHLLASLACFVQIDSP